MSTTDNTARIEQLKQDLFNALAKYQKVDAEKAIAELALLIPENCKEYIVRVSDDLAISARNFVNFAREKGIILCTPPLSAS